MKGMTIERSNAFFRGILRTSRGSVILVTVENMPNRALTVATNAAYGHLAEPEEGGGGVGQSIFIGQQYDAATQLSYLNARYYNGAQGNLSARIHPRTRECECKCECSCLSSNLNDHAVYESRVSAIQAIEPLFEIRLKRMVPMFCLSLPE